MARIFNMFLLQRKKDGKYWNNSGRRQSDKWVDTPSECRPFRTIGAVRHSRACYGAMPSMNKPPVGAHYKLWEEYWKRCSAWHADANRVARTAWFHLNYLVVPVRVNLEVKSV